MEQPKELPPAEREARLGKLEEKVQRIRTREDLASFAVSLSKAYEDGVFEYTHTADYLRGVSGALHNLSGYCLNQGLPDPKQPDWRWTGQILFLAFFNA